MFQVHENSNRLVEARRETPVTHVSFGGGRGRSYDAMNKDQAAFEIRKLEQELENLERSYAALEHGTWWAKQAFVVFIVVLSTMVMWCVVNDNIGFAAILLVMVLAFVWHYTRGRWIDTLTIGERTDAVELETQIVQWKKRLAALRGERS
jgi:hypothetical protein